jgi:hypothetical protein
MSTLHHKRPGCSDRGVTTARECEYVCEVGDLFDLDGGFWEVKSVDGEVVMYGKIGDDVCGGGLGGWRDR